MPCILIGLCIFGCVKACNQKPPDFSKKEEKTKTETTVEVTKVEKVEPIVQQNQPPPQQMMPPPQPVMMAPGPPGMVPG